MEDFRESIVDILYSEKFFNAAMGMARNVNDAKDLIQETSLKALRFDSKFSGVNLGGWLYMILKNTFINKTRFHYYHKIQLYECPELFSDEWLEPEVYTNDNKRGASSDLEWLSISINKLHKAQREPLQMAIDGLKMSEIAEKINKPTGTIKSRIFKAKRELKKMYDQNRVV